MSEYKKIILRPFDGYGDWISLCGMIRLFAEKYEEVELVMFYGGSGKKSFVENLFRDLNNVSVHDIYSSLNVEEGDDYVDLIIWDYGNPAQEVREESNYYNRFNLIGKKLGFDLKVLQNNFFARKLNPTRFTEEAQKVLHNNATAFYLSMGIPDNYRTEYFHYERDYDREDKFFSQLNLPKKYNVICEYGDNLIHRKYFSDNTIPVINIHNLADNLFDIIKVVENAQEIHLIENATSLLIYYLTYKQLINVREVLLHTYSRKETRRICDKNMNNIFIDMYKKPLLDVWKLIY